MRTLHFHIYVVIGSILHGGREQCGKKTKAKMLPARLVPAVVPSAAQNFYGRASFYLCGGRMEIEQFRRILSYEEGKLCLELGRGILTVYGDDLKIETLSARRLTLCGQILRTDFSKE